MISLPYGILALCLAVLLFRLDTLAASAFLLYVVTWDMARGDGTNCGGSMNGILEINSAGDRVMGQF